AIERRHRGAWLVVGLGEIEPGDCLGPGPRLDRRLAVLGGQAQLSLLVRFVLAQAGTVVEARSEDRFARLLIRVQDEDSPVLVMPIEIADPGIEHQVADERRNGSQLFIRADARPGPGRLEAGKDVERAIDGVLGRVTLLAARVARIGAPEQLVALD